MDDMSQKPNIFMVIAISTLMLVGLLFAVFIVAAALDAGKISGWILTIITIWVAIAILRRDSQPVFQRLKTEAKSFFKAIKPILGPLWQFIFMFVEKALAPLIVAGTVIIVSALVTTKLGAIILATIAAWIGITFFELDAATILELLKDGPDGWLILWEGFTG